MNQYQKSYALRRLDELVGEKYRAIDQKYPDKDEDICPKVLMRALRAGKLRVKRGSKELYEYDKIKEVFDLSPFEIDNSKNNELRDKARQEVKCRASKIKDQLVLGDSVEALELISQFAKDLI